MNKRRRNILHQVLDDLARLRDPISKGEALSIIQRAQTEVQKCADEEDEAMDNMPESFQWSAAVEDKAENVSDLNDASLELECLYAQCEEAEGFYYLLIKDAIANVVNLIKQTIHR